MGDGIRNSKITVGDVPFVKWYNEVHWPKHKTKYPKIVSKDDFAKVFDQVDALLKPELTLTEFIALFMIFCNETGGTFLPVVEIGKPSYFFDAIPKKKRSYNTLSGNIKAGDALKKRGVLSDPADIAAWNGEKWPEGSTDDVKKAAIECDFNKFRGRGLIQITGRTAYMAHVDKLVKKVGKGCEELTDAQLTEVVRKNPKVYLPMVKSFFSASKWPTWLAGLNKDKPEFHPVGLHISGGEAYAALYQWRCETLLAAIGDGYSAPKS